MLVTKTRAELVRLETRELRTREEIVALQRQWDELWMNCAEATPFQSPGWLIPWYEHLVTCGVRFLTYRTNSRLVGIAPFFERWRDSIDGRQCQ